MDIGAAFVANREASEAVQPGNRSLDDPPADAQPTPVGRSAPREDRDDAARPQAVAMRLGIVAAVTLERTGPPTWPSTTTGDGGQRIHHRIELGDVVDVGGRYLRDERDAPRIGDDVVFGALLAAIGWVRSSFFPPRTARTDPLSMTDQRWSRRPRRRSSASSVSCSCCQTPARCQATSRRQHVLPEPQPIWRGNICQGMPERRTKRIPVRIARSGIGVRPCRWPGRGRRFGIKGSSRAQIASSTRA